MMQERRYRYGEKLLRVVGRIEGEIVHVRAEEANAAGASIPGADAPGMVFQRLAPGDYLLRLGARQQHCIVAARGAERWLWIEGRTYRLEVAMEAHRRAAPPLGELAAPMPGQVLEVLVQPGQAVVAGQPLAILEAMKMQYEITAPRDGVVAQVHAAAGSQVAGGVPLVTLAPVPEPVPQGSES